MSASLRTAVRLRSFIAAALFAAVVGLTAVPREARSQAVVACVNCSTIFTQMMEYAKQIAIYAKQIEQYELQIKQWEDQVKNATNIGSSFFDNALGTVRSIETMMNNASNVRYMMSGLETQFEQSYPGVFGQLQQMRDLTPQQAILNDYSRGRQAYDAALTALRAAQWQSSDLSYDQYRMDSIGSSLIGATGRLDAIQAAGEYGQIAAQQMMKMRQIALVQVQLASQAMADEARRRDLDRAAAEVWAESPPRAPLDTPHDSGGF